MGARPFESFGNRPESWHPRNGLLPGKSTCREAGLNLGKPITDARRRRDCAIGPIRHSNAVSVTQVRNVSLIVWNVQCDRDRPP